MRVAPFLFLVFVVSVPVFAQPIVTDQSRSSPASFYKYSEAGDITIRVSVWGTVRYPGLYEVPGGTSLSTLFSLSGGPMIGSRRTRAKRQVTIRLARRSADGLPEVISSAAMLNDDLWLADDPVLQAGDVLTVDTTVRQGTSWRDIFPVIAAVASVALAIERISSP